MKHFAQLDQDAWIESLFPKGYKGYFVDIGAATGKHISNSYHLEVNLGWNGICVEPNPQSYAELKGVRKCLSFNLAIADRTGTAKFTLKGEMSQIVFENDSENLDIFGRGPSHEVIDVEVITPTELLKRANAPKVIDYLSLDTEGNERYILSVFPFHEYKVKAITVSGTSTTTTTCTPATFTGSGQIRFVVTSPSGTVNTASVCAEVTHVVSP